MKRAALVVLFTAVALSMVVAHLTTVDEELKAMDAIRRQKEIIRPWWTCEYTLNLLRRENTVLVYRVIFCAKEKCSRSHQTEYFEAFYDSKKNKLVKMVPVEEPDPPPINAN